MSIPLVLAAFGTTTRARQTYDVLDAGIRTAFPHTPVYWAFTSRMVKDRVRQEQGRAFKHPHQVLTDLAQAGHEWAVVQSLHLVCGHEFDRLLEEVKACPVRTSIGLPLLDSPRDYTEVVQAVSRELDSHDPDEALVLVGHGTDHAMWTAYPALERIARQHLGQRVFVGTVEGSPGVEDIVPEVVQAGYRRVCLVPFMLVAGMHFQEDLCGPEESWKAEFEARGVQVRYESRGVGQYAGVGDVFCRHIQEALEVIPDRVDLAVK